MRVLVTLFWEHWIHLPLLLLLVNIVGRGERECPRVSSTSFSSFSSQIPIWNPIFDRSIWKSEQKQYLQYFIQYNAWFRKLSLRKFFVNIERKDLIIVDFKKCHEWNFFECWISKIEKGKNINLTRSEIWIFLSPDTKKRGQKREREKNT